MGKLGSTRVVTNMSYEEVVAAWKQRNSEEVFTGHFLIRLTSELNSIEGIDVDYNRTRELFESESVANYTGDVRDLFSVLNNKNVAEFLEESLRNRVQLSKEFILETHRILMFGSLDNKRYKENGERAGSFKKKDYCVGRYDVGASPDEVPEMIEELCELAHHKGDPLKIATAFHCYFQNIHPFADGNGRTGRWLLNYMLVLNGHPPIVISTEDKVEYYKALEAFDADEEFAPLESLLRECTIRTYSAWSGDN